MLRIASRYMIVIFSVATTMQSVSYANVKCTPEYLALIAIANHAYVAKKFVVAATVRESLSEISARCAVDDPSRLESVSDLVLASNAWSRAGFQRDARRTIRAASTALTNLEKRHGYPADYSPLARTLRLEIIQGMEGRYPTY